MPSPMRCWGRRAGPISGRPSRPVMRRSGGEPAAGGADIGELYPSDDAALEGASSVELLRRSWATLAERGWSIVNVDAIVIMQEPRLAPHRQAMREALAAVLGVDQERVTVRASTTDLLGFTGRGEGAACQAVALLEGPE